MTGRLAEAHATPGGTAGRGASSASFVRDPTSLYQEVLRYAVAAVFAALAGGALIHAFGARSDTVEATDAEHAILVDLPASLTSSQPAIEAQEGPQQEALEAAPPTPPDPVETRQPVTDPKRAPPPPEPQKFVEPSLPLAQPTSHQPTPPVDDPTPVEPTVTPPKPIEAKPPATPAAAAPSPAVAAQAPSGSDRPVPGDHPESEEGQSHASARAITAWQRSLVGRLEIAKRALSPGTHRAAGTVQVAFAIDRDGRIVSERVAHSSGSAALDDTALSLVRRAAPFPTPPKGTGERDLSFIVPIRFRH